MRRSSQAPSLRSVLAVTAAAASLGLGCEQGDDGDFDFGDTLTGTTLPTVTTTSTVPTTGTETGTGDATTGPSTDTDDATGETGTETGSTGTDDGSTTEPLQTEACTTLDVLVVIDNSDTMAEEQVRLGAALPPFLALLDQQLPGIMSSMRIAVITTDAPEFVTASPAMDCMYASGTSYMTFGPDLMTELACATAVGTSGDPDERPMQMAIEALSPEMQGIDGANEGFLRETGPLVILFVTDEEDDFEAVTEWGSVGDPADWVDAIAATQDGQVHNVVPLSLVGHEPPNACPPYQWNHVDGAEIATRIIEFTEAFPRSGVGDLCAVEYTTFLNSAVTAVTTACNQWVPE